MIDAPKRVLVVEDEEPIRRFLRTSLTSRGYQLEEACGGREALDRLASQQIDLVILDLGLPDCDGMQVLTQLRTRAATPVVVLSARGRESEKVAAFEAGADDYLTKPFGVQELAARLHAVLRRSAQSTMAPPPLPYARGELVIDMVARRVLLRDQEVHVTPIEFKLLTLMAKHAGKVLTHRQLLQEVWGPEHSEEVNYLRVFMAGLRRKLEVNSAQPRYLLTEQGIGYRLADE